MKLPAPKKALSKFEANPWMSFVVNVEPRSVEVARDVLANLFGIGEESYWRS